MTMLMIHKSEGKFWAKWARPFVIETIFLNEAYNLAKSYSELLMILVNEDFLKKYYPKIFDKLTWDSLRSSIGADSQLLDPCHFNNHILQFGLPC